MQINVFNMKNNEVEELTLGKTKKVETYYSPGNITSTKQLGNSYACKTAYDNSTQYTVYGVKGGRFYNPWSSDLRADAVKRTHEWIRVTEKVFNSYVKFLNTNKNAFLTEAEQAFIYG